jgi:hypothetical protein
MWKKAILISIGLTNAADAHCYSRWYYPTPQKCGGVYSRQSHRSPVIARVDSSAPISVNDFNIPIPNMSADWGGALDTQLELQLRLRALGYQPDR